MIFSNFQNKLLLYFSFAILFYLSEILIGIEIAHKYVVNYRRKVMQMKDLWKKIFIVGIVFMMFISCTAPITDVESSTDDDGNTGDNSFKTNLKGSCIVKLVSDPDYPEIKNVDGAISNIEFRATINGKDYYEKYYESMDSKVYMLGMDAGFWLVEVKAYDKNNNVYMSKLETIEIVAGESSEPKEIVLEQVKVTPLTISPSTNDISVSNNIEISTATVDSTIYYTLDGTDPTDESTKYTGAFKLSKGSKTVKAVAFKGELEASEVLSQDYTVNDGVATPVISPDSGTYSVDQTVTMTCDTTGATIYYTLDGSTPTDSSTEYTGAFTLDTVKDYTVKAKAFKDAKESSTAVAEYTISNGQAAVASISPTSGSYSESDFAGVTITTAQSGVTIYYTTGGSTPTDSSTEYTGKISLTEGAYTVKAIVYADGFSPSEVVSAEYVITGDVEKVATPVITPSASDHEGSVTVEISTSTSGATIHYTTNGEIPTTTSTVYETSFELTDSVTVKAIAVKSGMNDSDMASKSYNITQAFDGIKILVASSLGYDQIHYWDCDVTSYTDTDWPGEKMTQSGDDYVKEFEGASALKLLITKDEETKLHGNDMNVTEKGTYRVTADGIEIEEEVVQKPSIQVSPEGGKVKGTDTVTITINSEEALSSKSASIGTTDLTFSGNTATFTVSTYIADTASKTLTVSATNEAGTSNVSYTFERDDNYVPPEVDFTWDNATVYFVMTDRFNNGRTDNDHSYGRRNDYGGDAGTIGTFHGGDIKGMTEKLDYLEGIGTNAIWITAPYEQIHGFVGGGWENGEAKYPHYAYHGYYTLDYTMMDQNMGTVEEFRTFVTTAHNKGIRVVLDIVMNHPGYDTLLDAAEYGFGGVSMSVEDARNWTPGSGQHWQSYTSLFSGANWDKWWSRNWIRAGYYNNVNNSGPLTENTSFLPDFKTEVSNSVGLAPILNTKWSKETSGYDDWIVPAADSLRQDLGIAPTDYVVKWLAAWVEEFGIDGFRVDTAKHVELYRWKQLKDAASAALINWRNSSRSNGDPAKDWTESFWMTGEHWNFNAGGGGHSQGDYYSQGGFDNMIDFGFKSSIPMDASSMISKWNWYASQDGKKLPYISSHDTGSVFYNGDSGRQITAGTVLLLTPGPVQIYYGDEIGRDNGPGGSDKDQGSRSAFQWDKVDNAINQHWSKIGTFRRNNPAVGAGSQSDLGDNTVARTFNDNKVVIKVGASGSTSVNVSGVFADGTSVRDAYTGAIATVSGGSVTFTDGGNGVILIEAAN